MSNKTISIILMLISITLILLSSYAPIIMENITLRYINDLKISVKICGVLLSAWGIAFLFKKEKEK